MNKLIIALVLFLGVSNAQVAPSNLTAQFVGQSDFTQTSSTYYYWVQAIFPTGRSTIAGPAVVTFKANFARYDNFVTVSWLQTSGATGYDVLRTTTSTTPTGACNCALVQNTSSNTIRDKNYSTSTYTVIPGGFSGGGTVPAITSGNAVIGSGTGIQDSGTPFNMLALLSGGTYTGPITVPSINGSGTGPFSITSISSTTLPATPGTGNISALLNSGFYTANAAGTYSQTVPVTAPNAYTNLPNLFTLGFTQYSNSSTNSANGWTYRWGAPLVNPGNVYSLYSDWWLDRGGINLSAVNGTPGDNALMRLSAVGISGTYEHTLEVLTDCTAGTFTCIGISPFMRALTDANGSNQPFEYGLNPHVSGCETYTCPAGSTNHDITIYGLETDVLDRSGNARNSKVSMGYHDTCVDCNNSLNFGIIVDALQSLTGGDPGYKPWGYGFSTSDYGALIGLQVGSTCAAANAPCASQPIISHAWLNSTTKLNYQLQIQPTGMTTWQLPGAFQFENYAGTALQIVEGLADYTVETANYSAATTDMDGGTFSNLGATGAVTITLPTLSLGMRKSFMVQAAQTFNITGAGAVSICYVNTCTGAGGTLASSTPFSYITLEYFSAAKWEIINYTGNWTVDGTPVSAALNNIINTVTPSATPTFNFALGTTQILNLSTNATPSYTNIMAGVTYNIIVCQPASGGPYTFTQPSQVHQGMTIGTTASKCNAQNFIAVSTSSLLALGNGVPNE